MSQCRKHRQKRFIYLLDHTTRTAIILRGHVGRCKTFRVPDYISVEGCNYTITGIDVAAFNTPRTLKHLIVPDTITHIDEDTLFGFPNLRSVHIGKGLEYMLSWHFRNCPKLRIVTIDKANPHLKIQNGLLLSKDGTILLRSFASRKELQIPEGVKYIEKVAFWYDDKIEKIHFPSTLKEIGDNSFSNLPNLRQLVLPEGLTRLAVQSFSECQNLQLIDLPSTLTDFGREDFTFCTRLETIILRSKQVMNCRLEDIEGIPLSANIYVPEELINYYKTHPVCKLFDNIKSISDL